MKTRIMRAHVCTQYEAGYGSLTLVSYESGQTLSVRLFTTKQP